MTDTSSDIILIQYNVLEDHLIKLGCESSLNGIIRVYATIFKLNKFNPKTIFYEKVIINRILEENNLAKL